MKVGIVSTALVKCGIATYSQFLAEELQKQGVNVTLLAEHPFPNERALDKTIKVTVPIKFCWKRTEFYDELIKEANTYDIIHIQHQFGLFNNAVAWGKLLKSITAKKIVTMHDIIPPNAQFQEYFTYTIELSDIIIVHTKTCYDMMLQWNCPETKLMLIPHGTKIIDIPDKITTRKELNIPENAKVILSWGFLWESKGVLEIVKILAEILKTYPNAMFIHAGGLHPMATDPTYLKNILRNAIKLGITPENLKITQWVEDTDVPKWFSIADVIVLNYMRGSASASGAAHRALASKRPLVKTDDLCLEDIAGETVPRFDITGLYQGIMRVLEDNKLADKLVAEAEAVAQRTSWEKIVEIHKKLYAS